MSVTLALILSGLLALVLVLVLSVALMSRRRALTRIDAVTRKIATVPAARTLPSHALEGSIDRLERAAEDRVNLDGKSDVALHRAMSALDGVTQGAIVADASGEVVFSNEFAGSFIGGRHGEALVSEAIDDVLAAALAGRWLDRELDLYGPPQRLLMVHGAPLEVDGQSVGALALIDDLTEPRRLDAMRSDFVANVSHELKTPVGGLTVLADALTGEHDLEVVDRLAGRMVAESTRLGQMIDDLLDLSRIEIGIGSDIGAVSLQGVVQEAMELIHPLADRVGVTVAAELHADPVVVEGDRRQLLSAVTNLVENAIKYSDDGQAVGVRVSKADGMAELVVQDAGVGIPQRDHDRVFERFYRVDQARDRATGGTGLGLSIVRHVVLNHRGEVTLESSEGRGSTFTIRLPAIPNPPAAQSREAS